MKNRNDHGFSDKVSHVTELSGSHFQRGSKEIHRAVSKPVDRYVYEICKCLISSTLLLFA
jgi:hypothetical protein